MKVAGLRKPLACFAGEGFGVRVGRDASGRVLAVWGTLSPGHRRGRFSLPGGLAANAQGDIFVADFGNNRIQELSPRGVVLAVWGKRGKRPGRFDEPLGVAVDARGDVYVADRGNKRVQKFSPRGTLLAAWS